MTMMSDLTVRVQQLISLLTPSTTPGLQRTANRCLTRLEEKLAGITAAVNMVVDEEESASL